MEKILIVYNPVAGKDATRPPLEKFVAQFPADRYEISTHQTTCTGDAVEYIKNNADGYDKVIACGGDGTLNETVTGLLNAELKIPVGYLPIGSTNDFASTLGIPGDIYGAVHTIKTEHKNSYDVGKFNDRYFNYVACFGPGSAISYNTPQKMKNKLGYSAYIINGFILKSIPLALQLKPRHIVVEYDGKVIDGKFLYGAISNSTSVAGMFKFGKQQIKLNDGKFEVLLVKNISNPTIVPSLINDVLKGEYKSDNLYFFKADKVKMTFDNEETWTLDGEYGGNPKVVEFSVQHNAIDIYSPKNPLFD